LWLINKKLKLIRPMQQPIITDKTKDPLGNAVLDFLKGEQKKPLTITSSKFDDDELLVNYLFRTLEQMPEIEQQALILAKGNILDVGAGAGCHSKALQKMGKTVTAIDISPGAVEVMQATGISDARHYDFFEMKNEKFDTILFLMNGAGLAGRVVNLSLFFTKIKELLSYGGQIILDSSDVKYLYENEDGSFEFDLNDNYYGEFDFSFQYGNSKSDTFNWFYIDFDTLSYYAEQSGFKAERIMDDSENGYLARIIPY